MLFCRFRRSGSRFSAGGRAPFAGGARWGLGNLHHQAEEEARLSYKISVLESLPLHSVPSCSTTLRGTEIAESVSLGDDQDVLSCPWSDIFRRRVVRGCLETTGLTRTVWIEVQRTVLACTYAIKFRYRIEQHDLQMYLTDGHLLLIRSLNSR
jgi:hypothetical protein